MSAKKSKIHFGKRATIITIIILVIVVGVAIYLSMHYAGKHKVETQTSADTTVVERPKVKGVETKAVDTSKLKPRYPNIDTVEKITIPKTETTKEEPSQGAEVKINPEVKVNFSLNKVAVPFAPDRSQVIYNSDGRYTLYYLPAMKQAGWVSYVITRNEAKLNAVERSNEFAKDKAVESEGWESPDNNDYKRSGYDKGHLLPSADRNDNIKENRATFLFSNISPQEPRLNRYTWKNLEGQVRRWALMYDSVCVVTGTVFNKNSDAIKRIGRNRLAVSERFFKVVLVKYNGKYHTIGFLCPNSDDVDSNYKKYAVTIDEVERISGYNFFYLLPDDIENNVESTFDRTFWF